MRQFIGKAVEEWLLILSRARYINVQYMGDPDGQFELSPSYNPTATEESWLFFS